MTTAQPVGIVTGASSGIGRATAAALADAGFTVVGTSRDSSRTAPLAGVTFLDLDVRSDASAQALADRVIQQFGRIDVLVNNAGVGALAAAEESTIRQAQDIFDVNVFGVIRMTNLVLPYMRAQGSGRVVNMSSVLGVIPAPFMAVYAATKHALEGYSESLDHEVRASGVRVVLVQPGYTSSQFEANAIAPDAPLAAYDAQRKVAAEALAVAMQSADQPGDVAKVVLKAATDTSPRLRYPAGAVASRVTLLRRLVPSKAFDKQIRKLNRLSA